MLNCSMRNVFDFFVKPAKSIATSKIKSGLQGPLRALPHWYVRVFSGLYHPYKSKLNQCVQVTVPSATELAMMLAMYVPVEPVMSSLVLVNPLGPSQEMV